MEHEVKAAMNSKGTPWLSTENLNKNTLLIPKMINYFTVDKLPEMTRFGTYKHPVVYSVISVIVLWM